MKLHAHIVLAVGLVLMAPRVIAQEQEHTGRDDRTSELEHVAPEPPQLAMHDMPYAEMAGLMGMDDRHLSTHVVIDQLEWREDDVAAWDGNAWFGRDEGKLWLKSEGERASGATRDARAELLYDRGISRWWSLQAGARQDYGDGPSRTWLALGMQGLAPHFFDVEATAYVGEQGRAALRFRTEYELRFTQRLILQPLLELNAYSKDDPERGLGAGLSDVELGLRLRYEIRRQFAPYAGITWLNLVGDTADFAQAAGGKSSAAQIVAGFRIWF